MGRRDAGETPALHSIRPAVCDEPFRQSPLRNLNCAVFSGTTLNLPWRTNGESAKSLCALISAKVTGLPSAFPILIFTRGFLGSEASTETTDAVPTALLCSPVS